MFAGLCVRPPPFCTCAVLVRFTAGTVNAYVLHVGVFGKDSEYGLKYACPFPFGKAFVYGIPVSINRRQISPRGIRPQDPKDSVDRVPDIIKRASYDLKKSVQFIVAYPDLYIYAIAITVLLIFTCPGGKSETRSLDFYKQLYGCGGDVLPAENMKSYTFPENSVIIR